MPDTLCLAALFTSLLSSHVGFSFGVRKCLSPGRVRVSFCPEPTEMVNMVNP